MVSAVPRDLGGGVGFIQALLLYGRGFQRKKSWFGLVCLFC